jgi:hypothetical protein
MLELLPTTPTIVKPPLLSLSKMAESEMQIWMMQMEKRVAELTAQLEFLN